MTVKWYILKTTGNHEEKLVSILNQAEDFRPFIIKKKKVIKSKHECKLVDVKLFPGYLFVMSSYEQKKFTSILQSLKKERMLEFYELRHDLDETMALHPSEQKMIECLIDKDAMIDHSTGFIVSDKITILEGPLMGMESQIKHIDRHKRRALIEIPLFNEVKEIYVSLEIVSKI